MATPDPDEIWQLLHEARFGEDGEAKVAAMERAVEAADAVGDPELVNYALKELIEAYEMSQDDTRVLVPFARLLRNFDTAPEHFDSHLTHSLFWTFKWVVNDMIDQPSVPLGAIEHWLEEMRRRYAEAGYSMHAVCSREMDLAFHVGDYERLAAAIEALGEAAEDDMSDCTACQYTSMGAVVYHSEEDSAEAVLQLIQPVLDDEHSCAHEPHFALALSLLPLVELGNVDQARANHLRGYAMVRGKEDMLRMVSVHIEFCALTGNEARAVEILAEHARFFDAELNMRDRQRLLEVTVLTTRRLRELGHGGTLVRGPEGREWTADELYDRADAERREIIARFDARNGNAHHSERSHAAVARAPYATPVALGLKQAAPPRRVIALTPETADRSDLDTAIDAAYEAYDTCTEHATRAWLSVDGLARVLGVELIPEHRAEIAYAEAAEAAETGDDAAAHAWLARAAELFDLAGQPGRALVPRAAAAAHTAGADRAAASETAARIVDTAARLRAEGGIDDRSFHTAMVLALRAQAASGDAGIEPRIDALDADLARQDHPYALIRRCDLAELRARIAPEAEAAIACLHTARDHALASGRPWILARADAELADRLGRAGRAEDARAYALEGIEALGVDPSRAVAAKLYLQAADAAYDLGDPAACQEYALNAATHCDAAGLTVAAAIARHLLGSALIAQNRHQEAVLLLEDAVKDLPDAHLLRIGHLRRQLTESYAALGDPRAAAEHGLAGLALLESASGGDVELLHTGLLMLTANQLENLGDTESAMETYRRAIEASERIGHLDSWARASRARVWLDVRTATDHDPFAEGLRTMATVAARLHDACVDQSMPEDARASCRMELGETYRQHAQLTYGFLDSQNSEERLRRDEAEPVLDLQYRALAVFSEPPIDMGEASLTAHQIMWLLDELGDTAGALAFGEEFAARLDPTHPEYPETRNSFDEHLADLRGGTGR